MVYNNITVEMPQGITVAQKEEAKNYVSLLALYRLVPDQLCMCDCHHNFESYGLAGIELMPKRAGPMLMQSKDQ